MNTEIKIPWTRNAKIWAGISKPNLSWKTSQKIAHINALLDQRGLRLRWHTTARSVVVDVKP